MCVTEIDSSYLVVATGGVERIGSTCKESFVVTWHQHFDVVVTLILWKTRHWLLLALYITPAWHTHTQRLTHPEAYSEHHYWLPFFLHFHIQITIIPMLSSRIWLAHCNTVFNQQWYYKTYVCVQISSCIYSHLWWTT